MFRFTLVGEGVTFTIASSKGSKILDVGRAVFFVKACGRCDLDGLIGIGLGVRYDVVVLISGATIGIGLRDR